MTIEQYNKAMEINREIQIINGEIPMLEERVKRFDDYLHLMDGRTQPPLYGGKPMKKVELKINVETYQTSFADRFDMVEENRTDFITFLKKCQTNYQKKIDKLKSRKVELEEEFVKL